MIFAFRSVKCCRLQGTFLTQRVNDQLQSITFRLAISMTLLLNMGTKQKMETIAMCKDTSHPKTITGFSGVSHPALKTEMSIPIMPFSELLLTYSVGGTLKNPGINLSGTLHRKIIFPVTEF